MTDLQKQFKEKFSDITKIDVPLSKMSTFKIGGNAAVLIEPKNTPELLGVCRFVYENKIPFKVIGGGSNVVFSDRGFTGVIIRPRNNTFIPDPDSLVEVRANLSTETYYDVPGFEQELIDFYSRKEKFVNRSSELLISPGGTVYVGAGIVLAKLAMESAKEGFIGLEWGIAVPGTLGGAIRGNAGAFGGEIKDNFEYCFVFDMRTGKVRQHGLDDMGFGYRTSRIKKNRDVEVVLGATFQLAKGDKEEVVQKAKELLKKKFDSQPMGELCAGCLFKNIELNPGKEELSSASKGNPTDKFFADIKSDHPEFIKNGKVPAGWIIDQLGFKEKEPHNGIKVSDKHANFLVNVGGGTEEAVKEVVENIKKEARDVYGIELEEEVEFVS